MQRHLWALYRRSRTAVFSWARRNPLSFRSTYTEELRAVRLVRHVHANPPKCIKRDGELRLWETPIGPMWAPQRADAAFMRFLAIEHVLNIYRYTGSAGDVVIDCGSNIGMFSRPIADSGTSLVIAFEPCKEAARAFARNLEKHIDRGTVQLHERGVWSEQTVSHLQYGPTANPGAPSVTSVPGEHTVPIELTTIDSVVEQLNLTRVDFIKMDVEGAETQALRGAAGTIRRFRPRIGLGTEHGEDILANNFSVIETVHAIEAGYRATPTDVRPDRGMRGWMLVPQSLALEPPSE